MLFRSIGKVEQWDAYKHINAQHLGIVQAYGRDELDAYMRTQKALDSITLCEEY